MARKGTKIEVNRKDWKQSLRFNSIKKFADSFKINYTEVMDYLYGKRKDLYGYEVKRLSEKMTYKKGTLTLPKSTRKVSKRACKVQCVETGKIFSSISEAARHLNVQTWTMSLKMEKAGKFIDKKGNTYIRLKPMVSKDLSIYPEQTPEITRNLTRSAPRKVEKIEVANAISTQAQPTVAVSEKKEIDIDSTLKLIANTFVEQGKFDDAITIISAMSALKK